MAELVALPQMVDDLAGYLVTQGIETRTRLVPDAPDHVVVLQQTAGLASDLAVPIDRPGLQVLIRDADVEAADEVARTVLELLIDAFPLDVETRRYYRIEPTSSSSFQERDGKARAIMTLNFVVARSRHRVLNEDPVAVSGAMLSKGSTDTAIVANLLRLRLQELGYSVPVYRYQLPDAGISECISIVPAGGAAPSLARPYSSPELVVRTRASDVAVGETLAQLCHDALHRAYSYEDADTGRTVHYLAAQGSPALSSSAKGYEHEFRLRSFMDR